MSIRRHLILLILVAIASLIFLGATSFFQFQRNTAQVRVLTDGALPGFLSAAELSAKLKDMQIAVTAVVYAPPTASPAREVVEAGKKGLQDGLEEQARFAQSAAQRGLVEQAQESLKNYLAAIDDVVQQRSNGQRVIAEALLDAAVAQYQQELQSVLETLRVEKRRYKEESVAALQSGVEEASLGLGLAMALALSVLVAAGYRLYRQISQPLQEMERTMTEIAQSLDLTRRVPVTRRDEIGQAISAFNSLLDTLQSSLSEMILIIKNNQVASLEMHESAVVLAHMAADGDSASRGIHSAVMEIQSQINHITSRTREAETLTTVSGEQATENGRVIRETVNRILELAHSVGTASGQVFALVQAGTRIADVVAEIRQIADQTNLLALNAAIEAARAGDSGRGFAVVADEVRKLAERVSQATASVAVQITAIEETSSTTAELMNRVVADMEKSMDLAKSAGLSMGSIEAAATQVIGVVGNIQQLVGVGRTSSHDIVDQVSTIQALMGNANSAASHTRNLADAIRHISGRMGTIVDRFTVGHEKLALGEEMAGVRP
ncbi:MAG: histidine kinase [Proteobacteria bacterium]|nr:histidine kinase [Pseudomonadota bacterium]